MMSVRSFARRPELELLVRCARTAVPESSRAAIRRRVSGPLNWNEVLRQATRHGVGPLLYRNLSTCCPDLVPVAILANLRQRTQAGLLLNRALIQELVSVCDAFEAQEVPVLPIKGATLAAMAYGDPALRDFGDMDLLIPERALREAQAVLTAQGYEPKDPSADPEAAEHEDGPYHVYIKKRSLSRVDLQWMMAHECFEFRLDRPEFWKRCTPVSLGEQSVPGLSAEDLLIVLCVHGSKHAWEQLKWVCDVAELLRSHPSMDWARILTDASAWRCRRYVLLGLAAAHQLLEAPLPAKILAQCLADEDVRTLAARMPWSLLNDPREGVSEQQAVALYFSLKDSWSERWFFGLRLCRYQHPMLDSLPHWFRWRRTLPWLARFVGPLQNAARYLVPGTLRDAINRWIDRGGEVLPQH
jgi:hypothetical protein